jgi:hypothetical protein
VHVALILEFAGGFTFGTHTSIQNLESDIMENMENLLGVGRILVFAALFGFALRRRSRSTSPVELSEPGSKVEQIRRILAGRAWLIKDALIAMLLFGFLIIFTISFGESPDSRYKLIFMLCTGPVDRCSCVADQNLQLASKTGAIYSCVAVCLALITALFRWVRLVSLTGRVRLGRDSILPEERFRYRVTAKRIFVGVLLLHALLIAHAILVF